MRYSVSVPGMVRTAALSRVWSCTSACGALRGREVPVVLGGRRAEGERQRGHRRSRAPHPPSAMIAAISTAPVTAIASPPRHGLPPAYRASAQPAVNSIDERKRVGHAQGERGLLEHEERDHDREGGEHHEEEDAERSFEIARAESGLLGRGRRLDQAPAHALDCFGPHGVGETRRERFRDEPLPGGRVRRHAAAASSVRLRVRSVTVRTRYITASASPHARLQPSAAIIIVRTSSRPAVATLSDPVKVNAMSNPKITSDTRSIGSRTGAGFSAFDMGSPGVATAAAVRGSPLTSATRSERPGRPRPPAARPGARRSCRRARDAG